MRLLAWSVLAVVISAALPARGYGCTRTAFAASLPADFVYFVGRARADTLPVSPFDRPVDPLGRPWVGEWRPPAFGQSVRVWRIGGTLAPGRTEELERLLRASDSVVVLVPWETTAGCSPAPWLRSVRWIAPGAEGLYRGRLRARSAWVHGVPTVDVVLPSVQPYPSGPSGAGSPMSSTMRRARLTATELFDLFRALPLDSALRRRPEAATEPLRRWAATNPALAVRYPAADMLRQARSMVRHYRTRLVPLPLAGTYRFTVELSDRQSFSFHARTETAPISTWDDARLASEADSLPWFPDRGRPPTGFHAEVVVARAVEELPRTRVEAERRQQPRYSFRIAASPSEEHGGVQHWRGAVDFAGEALPVLATDSASAVRLRDLAERAREVFSVADPRGLPATFRRSSDGRVEVRQQLRLGDGRLLTIRGVRVSDVAIAAVE